MFKQETNINIDLKEMQRVVVSLKAAYDKIGSKETKEGRSKFSAYNNIMHMYERLTTDLTNLPKDDHVLVPVVGAAKGSTFRVYNTPSFTSLAKPVRSSIVPVNPNHKFVYFDLKSAEFFMNCLFCQQKDAVDAYHAGEDIYMHYASIFPEGTERKVIKEALIANMYGMSSYTLGLRCGVSEAHADRILATIQRALPAIEAKKISIIAFARRNNGYYCPNVFDQTDLIRVADIDPKKGFLPNLALSAYVQSALGLWMQRSLVQLQPLIKGTLLSVFDSVLAEINPDSFERYKAYINKMIVPFRVGAFGFGSTMLEAQNSAD